MSAYLTESGILQRDWAKRCGRDEKWATAVLNGHRGVQAADLPKIAKALGTTLQQFVKRWAAILDT